MPLEELERRARGYKGEERHSQEPVIRTDPLPPQLNIVKDACPVNPRHTPAGHGAVKCTLFTTEWKTLPRISSSPIDLISPNLVRFIL